MSRSRHSTVLSTSDSGQRNTPQRKRLRRDVSSLFLLHERFDYEALNMERTSGKDRACLRGRPGKLVDYHLPVWECQGIAFGPPSNSQIAYSDRRECPSAAWAVIAQPGSSAVRCDACLYSATRPAVVSAAGCSTSGKRLFRSLRSSIDPFLRV